MAGKAHKRSASILALLAPLAVAPIAKAEDSTVIKLEQEVEALKLKNESLESRLKALESRQANQNAAPSQPSAGGAQAEAGPSEKTPAYRMPPSANAATSGSQSNVQTVNEIPKSVEDIYQTASGFSSSKLSIEPAFTYSYYDTRELRLNGFLALDSIFLGNINLERIKSNIYTFDLTTRYSPSPRWQFDVDLPTVGRKSTFFSGGAGGAGTTTSDVSVARNLSVGDISAGVSYKLVQENQDWPDIVGSIRIKAPTGKKPYGIKVKTDPGNNNLSFPEDLPTGNGVWGVTAGLSFVKTIDPAVVFANFGYTYYRTTHFDDISTSPTEHTGGSVSLGNPWQFGAGIAFALNDRLSLGLSYSQLYVPKSRTKVDGQGWQDIEGSQANSATANFGLTYALSKNFSIIPNLAIGLTPDAPNYSISIKFPYTF